MNQKYTLHCFDDDGLAKTIYLLLTYGNINFEIIKYSREDWLDYKDSMPLKVLPVLQIDNQKFNQSKAICRYLAKKNNLNGDNESEALQIDIVIETIEDLKYHGTIAFHESNENAQKNMYETFAEYFHTYLEKMNREAGSGYLALDKLTWADLVFTGLYDNLVQFTRVDIGNEYPNLKKVVNNVKSLPQIINK